jgi:hypothetical protein
VYFFRRIEQKRMQICPENPFSTQDACHHVWAKATRAALIDLHALKQRYLEKPSILDRALKPDFPN